MNQFIKREPVIVRRQTRYPSEEAHGLEMHAAHGRRRVHGKPDNITYVVGINPSDQRWHQCHSKVKCGTVLNGSLLCFKQGAVSEFHVYRIICSVKLHEYKRETCISQCFYIFRVTSKPDSVCVKLDVLCSGLPCSPNDIGKVSPCCWFTSAELDKTFPGNHQVIK